MTREEIIDELEIYTVGRLKKARVHITVEELQKFIDEIKALEQEPKTGHWTRKLIRNERGGCIGAEMICSNCKTDNKHDENMKYCPNCGAKKELRTRYLTMSQCLDQEELQKANKTESGDK